MMLRFMDEREMEEIRKLNEELQSAKEGLEKLNHFKNHLLSFTSHQVKSPLAVIKGYADLLLKGEYGEIGDRAQEILGRIKFAAEDLINMVDNLIDLRRVEEGRIEYRMEKFDWAETVKRVADGFRPIILSRGLDFLLKVQKESFWVLGDEGKLRHVVQNLLDNAVKYTKSGYIKVDLEERGGRALLAVEDSGIGIPADSLQSIFGEFVRNESAKEETEGSGIGLFLAKNIVDAHGGKIWAESRGPGRGSAFHVELNPAG